MTHFFDGFPDQRPPCSIQNYLTLSHKTCFFLPKTGQPILRYTLGNNDPMSHPWDHAERYTPRYTCALFQRYSMTSASKKYRRSDFSTNLRPPRIQFESCRLLPPLVTGRSSRLHRSFSDHISFKLFGFSLMLFYSFPKPVD